MTTNSGDNDGFGKRRNSPRLAMPKPAGSALRPAAGTPPPKRSRHSRNRFVVFLNFLLSIVILAVLAAGVVFYFGKREFEASGPAETAATVLVKPKTGLRGIASLLERNGLIRDSRIFTIGVGAYGNQDRLKAGEYEVEAGASMHDIMDLLESGKTISYSLTIPEGLTVEQAFDRIAAAEELSGDMPDKMPPEGSLAADTIPFTRGTPRMSIIEKLESEQTELVDKIWKGRAENLPLTDRNAFLTLASIVEKETGVAGERPRVAAVFLNRLRKGMRLQSDPTIIYGLYGGKGKPSDRPIYQSDLDKSTPFNTYQIDGLPPSPIATPGKAALEAVANPAKTDDLYFVADGTGGHVFSSTLKEHNENVARWRKLKKEEKGNAAKSEAAGNADEEKLDGQQGGD